MIRLVFAAVLASLPLQETPDTFRLAIRMDVTDTVTARGVGPDAEFVGGTLEIAWRRAKAVAPDKP